MPVTATPPSRKERTERRRLLAAAVGTAFDAQDRVFGDAYSPTVFDYSNYGAADIARMLGNDGKARSVYQVLTLPIRAAVWRIDDEAEDVTAEAVALCREVLAEKLPTIIDQCTTALAYKRAFFETTWVLRDGRLVYDEIALRPATTCERGFDPRTGKPRGFRQRVTPVGGLVATKLIEGDPTMPGYHLIAPERAFVYTHGEYAEPIRGVSDLDTVYSIYETKQKLKFLWAKFLENQAQPIVVAYGDDLDAAEEVAEDIATTRGGGVLGMPRPADPQAKAFDILEASGQGAAQFKDAVQFCSSEMVESVLAGFTELASAAASGKGSFALSADQSEFFLASRQAVADEIAEAIRRDLFGPLVRMNLGADAVVPKLMIGPISNADADRSLTLLSSLAAATSLVVPREIIDMLTEKVAPRLGLSVNEVAEHIEAERKRREEQDELKLKQQKQLLENPIPPGGTARPPAPGKAASTPAQRPNAPTHPMAKGAPGAPAPTARPKSTRTAAGRPA